MNNLFHYATSELSQDAFLCWLLQWAAPDNKETPLYKLGVRFVQLLTGDGTLVVTSFKIYKQLFHLDIVCVVNEQHIIAIEDKRKICEHDNQLIRYKESIQKSKLSLDVKPHYHFWYIQTGQQACYSQIENCGYRVITRTNLLRFFDSQASVVSAANNAILDDFVNWLREVQSDVDSYKVLPINEEWTFSAWMGFYTELCTMMPNENMEWKYVANPSGGFLGCWWHRSCITWDTGECDIYLQLEQQKLCIKAKPYDSIAKERRRDMLFDLSSVFTRAWDENIRFSKPPRLRTGRFMTLAVNKDYRVAEVDKKIDMKRTVDRISTIMRHFDRIVESLNVKR